jgi:hypothetical protein
MFQNSVKIRVPIYCAYFAQKIGNAVSEILNSKFKNTPGYMSQSVLYMLYAVMTYAVDCFVRDFV